MQKLGIGFLIGFTGNAIVTRLEGHRSMEDFIFPCMLFILSIAILVCEALKDRTA